ncbi:MAG TPA: surface layer protein B [Candidatus Aminicenantes bacterium]|nr:surface layer protein B [Candidatus Aminicenantes bacterium]
MSRWRLLFLLAFFVMFSLFLVAQQSPWRLAPPNPEFSRFFQATGSSTPAQAESHPGLAGLVPSPLDLSHLLAPATPAVFPRRFDLRGTGRLPLIRDQDGYPACQAFATMGMLESMLLPQEKLDLSEWHIYRYHGFDFHNEYGDYTGGNWQMNAAYLLRWSGPVGEEDSPYGSGDDPDALQLPPVKHIQNMRFFAPRRDALDNAEIKQFLMAQGPFYVSIFYDSSSYNSSTASHYYSGEPNANHGVLVVGWDDDYNRNRFLQIPPENGAFILRNSWGGQYGDGGYFYMSYYDTGFMPRIGVPRVEEADNYGLVYQYDPLGVISFLGGVSSHAWGCNVFSAREAGELTAVGFYLMDSNSAYTIRVYRRLAGESPETGRLYLEQQGTWPHAGFITVPLEAGVPLAQDERFAVAVHFQTPGTRYPIPVEYPINGYSSPATASPGQSFVSLNGEGWHDLTGILADSNVCIKGYSAYSTPVQASISARLLHSAGWILSYPYVSVDVSVDFAGVAVESVAVYRRDDTFGTRKVMEIPVAELAEGAVEWLDTSVSTGRDYAYQVRCFGPGGRFRGRSGWSTVEVVQ